jgi:hypothetical protein
MATRDSINHEVERIFKATRDGTLHANPLLPGDKQIVLQEIQKVITPVREPPTPYAIGYMKYTFPSLEAMKIFPPNSSVASLRSSRGRAFTAVVYRPDQSPVTVEAFEAIKKLMWEYNESPLGMRMMLLENAVGGTDKIRRSLKERIYHDFAVQKLKGQRYQPYVFYLAAGNHLIPPGSYLVYEH